MILNWWIGKSRLWAGQPFTIGTILEWEQIIDSGIPDPGARGEVTFRPVGGGKEIRGTPLPENLPTGVIAVETLNLMPGVYEVTVHRGGAQVILPEYVWILSREDYSRLAESESSEPFAFEPIVSNQHELEYLLSAEVSRHWRGGRNPFSVSWSNDSPISYPPIHWTISTLLEAVRYVAVFGVSDMKGFVSVGPEIFEIGVEMMLTFPVPGMISSTYHDPQCSDLLLLNANRDLASFDVDIQFRYNEVKLAVRHLVPQLTYA
jgi:hypothetical protein